jgi:hypothetical protein
MAKNHHGLYCTCKHCGELPPLLAAIQAKEPGVPYQKHSPTSKAAAHDISGQAHNLREVVFNFIDRMGARGATDDEIEVGLQISPSTVRPRRVELVEAGKVVDSGRTRPTRSGRQAVVWIARRWRDDVPQANEA